MIQGKGLKMRTCGGKRMISVLLRLEDKKYGEKE